MSGLAALHILLVDDNPHMRMIASAILKSAGAKVIQEVDDGAKALEVMRHFPADLAIVDFNMFPLDGVAFTRLIRNSEQSPNPYLPIIMMTGHSERSRVQEARDAGVTEFVVKPITAKAMLERIHAVVFRPRPFIRTDDYFGPCRRRVPRASYAGPFRRSTDAQTGPATFDEASSAA